MTYHFHFLSSIIRITAKKNQYLYIRPNLKRLLSKTRELAAALLCLYTSIAAVPVQQDMSPYVLVIFISQPMASFLNLSHLT